MLNGYTYTPIIDLTLSSLHFLPITIQLQKERVVDSQTNLMFPINMFIKLYLHETQYINSLSMVVSVKCVRVCRCCVSTGGVLYVSSLRANSFPLCVRTWRNIGVLLSASNRSKHTQTYKLHIFQFCCEMLIFR